MGDARAGDLWVCWLCPLSRVPPSPHVRVGEDPCPPLLICLFNRRASPRPPCHQKLAGPPASLGPSPRDPGHAGPSLGPCCHLWAECEAQHRVGGAAPRPCSPYLLQIDDPRFTSACLFPPSVPSLHVHMQVEPPKPRKDLSLGTSQNSDPPSSASGGLPSQTPCRGRQGSRGSGDAGWFCEPCGLASGVV